MSFQILNQPYDVNTTPGSTATFAYLVADPSGVLTYQWLTDNHRIARLSGFQPLPGAEIDGTWPIVGANAASYTTPILLAGDVFDVGDNGSIFLCRVTDTITTSQQVDGQSLKTGVTGIQYYTSRCAYLQVH